MLTDELRQRPLQDYLAQQRQHPMLSSAAQGQDEMARRLVQASPAALLAARRALPAQNTQESAVTTYVSTSARLSSGKVQEQGAAQLTCCS
ncbi:hypothetical protein PC128_g15433 [Phytophthora cactorum]|nr:hypothetical protein PC128_g15433 [Phytophthora cactorum]